MESPKPKIMLLGPEDGDHLYNWIRPIQDRYEFHTVTLHPFDDLPKIHHHRIRRITGTRLDFFLQRGELRRLIRQINPDLIHAHYLSSYGLMLEGIAKKIPRMLTIWGSDVNKSIKNPLLRWLCAKAARSFHYINSPSENIAGILRNWRVNPSAIEVYQYGIHTQKTPKRISRVGDSTLRLVSFRDWAPLYRIENVIRGFHVAYQKDPRMELHLLGRRNAEQEASIRREIEAGPAKSAIKVYSFLSRQDLDQLLTGMDVFFSVPTMDGMPLSLLEGLCIGLVPIVSEIPPNREWLAGEKLPWVDQATPEEMANAILSSRDFLHDEAAIERRRQKVLSQGDFAKNVARLTNAYDRLGGKKP